MKLSVIIPVYNAANTLERCMRSVSCQSFTDWEMILVDDGSSDGSGEMADTLAGEDSRIKVAHRRNGGVSAARNTGLMWAGGDCVMFIDSDDEISPDTLAPLMRLMESHPEVDILEFPSCVRYGHPSCQRFVPPCKIWKSASDYWHETEGWEHAYVWNKVFRAKVFNGLLFPKGRIFEDLWVCSEMMANGVKVMTTDKGMYTYRWNGNGLTSTADGSALEQLLETQMRAARLMHTTPWKRNGWKLYRSMLYRQVDVYRLTGKLMLRFPLVKTICKIHMLCR